MVISQCKVNNSKVEGKSEKLISRPVDSGVIITGLHGATIHPSRGAETRKRIHAGQEKNTHTQRAANVCCKRRSAIEQPAPSIALGKPRESSGRSSVSRYWKIRGGTSSTGIRVAARKPQNMKGKKSLFVFLYIKPTFLPIEISSAKNIK